MTNNQIKYWTLQEERRANRAKEANDRIAAEGAKLRGEGAYKQAEIAEKLEKKKVNENLWKPAETISNNIAKILGGVL